MKVLLLCHSFNSLAQRLHVELREKGHRVSVELDIHDSVLEEALAIYRPDVLIAPFLKRAIPESAWKKYRCLIVHPGIVGDRGPSALDWAILRNEKEWGVTVLQANGEFDAGDIWSSRRFPMREASKGSIYRNETSDAAVACVLEALKKMESGNASPVPLDYSSPDVTGRPHAPIKSKDRNILWTEQTTEEIHRRVRSADGSPGAAAALEDQEFLLFDSHPEDSLRGEPGRILARRRGGVCVGTKDGAVWIGHLRRLREDDRIPSLKLPSCLILGEACLEGVPEVPASGKSFREIWYEEENGVGTIYFSFYNGAMGTEQCHRLRKAVREAKSRPTKVLVLMGGPDFWSNGIHLGLIENAESPADESWNNIQAMDDLVLEILDSPDHLTVSAMNGNAGAGGVFLALASDYVWTRKGIVLNPHYKGMGNLYGSEYWTYLLPRRTGTNAARLISQARLPVGTAEAHRLRLIDDSFGNDSHSFAAEAAESARNLALDPSLPKLLKEKMLRRRKDEALKPLKSYRAEELERMRLNFYGFDPSYHVARYNFIRRIPKSRTPSYLAAHRFNASTPQHLPLL